MGSHVKMQRTISRAGAETEEYALGRSYSTSDFCLFVENLNRNRIVHHECSVCCDFGICIINKKHVGPLSPQEPRLKRRAQRVVRRWKGIEPSLLVFSPLERVRSHFCLTLCAGTQTIFCAVGGRKKKMLGCFCARWLICSEGARGGRRKPADEIVRKKKRSHYGHFFAAIKHLPRQPVEGRCHRLR